MNQELEEKLEYFLDTVKFACPDCVKGDHVDCSEEWVAPFVGGEIRLPCHCAPRHTDE